MNWQKLKREY